MNGPFTLLLDTLTDGAELTPAQIEAAVAALTDECMNPTRARPHFLRALRARGETPGEIAGFATGAAPPARWTRPSIPARMPGPMIDVCGTGGDRLHIVQRFDHRGAGARGRRGVRGQARQPRHHVQSGGADVLAALGVPLELPPEGLRRSLETTGFGFLFAPQYHPAFKAVAAVRRQLAAEGVSTIFNLLGPLLNPARPAHQLVGVYSGRGAGNVRGSAASTRPPQRVGGPRRGRHGRAFHAGRNARLPLRRGQGVGSLMETVTPEQAGSAAGGRRGRVARRHGGRTTRAR